MFQYLNATIRRFLIFQMDAFPCQKTVEIKQY